MTISSHSFIENFREPGTTRLSISTIGDVLGLQEQELAELAGVPVGTLRTHPESAQLQRVLRDLLRTLYVAVRVEPDVKRCAALFKHSPISTLGNKTLMQLVRDGRSDDAVGYLESVGAGYHG